MRVVKAHHVIDIRFFIPSSEGYNPSGGYSRLHSARFHDLRDLRCSSGSVCEHPEPVPGCTHFLHLTMKGALHQSGKFKGLL